MCTQSSLSAWMLQWLAEAADDAKSTMIQGLYALWLARNDARDGKKIEEPQEIARAVAVHMEEWQKVHGVQAPKVKCYQHEKWKPPEQGWVKVNVDGAMSKSGRGGGGGVVFRDAAGAFRGAVSNFFPEISKAETAELLACRRAVQLAIQRDIQKLHIETDCQVVAGMLNDQERNLSSAGQVVEEVKAMLKTRREFKLTWVRRSANGAAHLLAKLGVSSRASAAWDSVPPDCIPGLLQIRRQIGIGVQ